MRSWRIEDLREGMTASYSQTITDYDVKAFAGISGDHNPIHIDDEYAAKSRFKRRIAHGFHSASFFRQYSEPSYLGKAVYMPHKA